MSYYYRSRYVKEPLKLGDLKGNRFTVVLRYVCVCVCVLMM